MPSNIFLHSEVQDPYLLYAQRLASAPVHWEETDRLWAVYSYAGCQSILRDSRAEIPAVNMAGLNEYALSIVTNLTRLSNSVQHEIARETTRRLLERRQGIAIAGLVEQLLEERVGGAEMANVQTVDWVEAVCKPLPVLAVLRSFDFNPEECEVILSHMPELVKIMRPDRVASEINECAKEVYLLAERKVFTPIEVSNLIGLFIQSYDAGRGLLSNVLLQLLKAGAPERQLVVETLRFAPPVHNTRRVAASDIILGGALIKKGDPILLMLAAANRDPRQFSNPDQFDIGRSNNHEQLAFGYGGHSCLADHFSIGLVVETMTYLFGRYTAIQLLDEKISYEPLANVRLPKNIHLKLQQ